jgi:hypothetical protein
MRFRSSECSKGGSREELLWVLESPDKGFEECFSSSGRRKRRSRGSGRALGGVFASKSVKFLEFVGVPRV